MPTVPNVIGFSRPAAEDKLASLMLRYIARFPFDASGQGKATEQDPVGGTVVPSFTVVTVSYPSPLGPLPDSAVLGPTLPAGVYEGLVEAVFVGNPWGKGEGAWIELLAEMETSSLSFTVALYFDHDLHDGGPIPRTEWMKRGAMLALAQRAFTHRHKVRLVLTSDLLAQSIEIRGS